MPVSGHITSSFGRRRHPILGYTRMHDGIDIGARYGSPIHAAADGTVAFAGRNGGYGTFLRVEHSGASTTGYCPKSRIAVRAGAHVQPGPGVRHGGPTGVWGGTRGGEECVNSVVTRGATV